MPDAPSTTASPAIPPALRAYLENALPRYLADLEHLVDTDSGTTDKAGVDAVGAWVADRMRTLGAEVTVLPHAELGDTVVGTWTGRAGGPTVLLVGHTDTVFDPGTAAARPFTIIDGRATGPGVNDMQAGLLAGLYAIEALRAVSDGGELPVGRLVYVANPDEEIGSPSSTPHIRRYADGAAAAFILEAGRESGAVVAARKGNIEARVTIAGRGAHAGIDLTKGASALLAAAHLAIALDGLNGRWEGVSVSPGILHSGTRRNVVPDAAVLEIDVRAFDPDRLAAVEAAITELLAEPAIPGTSATYEAIVRIPPMPRTAATERLLGQASAIAAELGWDLASEATGGASDGNTTAGAGVPTLDGLGPVGGGSHGPDEYLLVDSVVPRTTLLAALIAAVGEGSTATAAQPEVTR